MSPARQELHKQLWNIANDLRGNMAAADFKDYILGFIFLKFLSEKIVNTLDEALVEDGYKFIEVYGKRGNKELSQDIYDESIEKLGYFLDPKHLFSNFSKKAAKREFILDDLAITLKAIEESTKGKDSEDDFIGLFDDIDLTSIKLGKTPEAKNELISNVINSLDKIDFHLEDQSMDVLGDAYEYLIGQFAANAGQKAGEFYTPQQVSSVLAQIVTLNKKRIKNAYDPTCGSGSLLLRIAIENDVEIAQFSGQEMNPTTYSLARMNMLLHGIKFDRFNIKQGNTLEEPQHKGEKFEAVVANPPFSAHWSASNLFLSDERFSDYGKLAPKTKADFAFIQHMIYHLADNGTMAVVVPHGVLFRGAAEGHIRRYLIEERNYLDAVIGLPANLFFGTSIPTCILVFKKNRKKTSKVLFIDSSGAGNFEKVKTQNVLRPEDITKIVKTYEKRKTIDKYSYVASMAEIIENDYNLNIPRYVDTFEEEAEVDLAEVSKELKALDKSMKKTDAVIAGFCKELGVEAPF